MAYLNYEIAIEKYKREYNKLLASKKKAKNSPAQKMKTILNKSLTNPIRKFLDMLDNTFRELK